MRLIILNAGDSFELDGFNKLLIRHPVSGKTILDTYVEQFGAKETWIVVGYRAVEMMSLHPEYNYVYNSKWQTTNNAYSLSLALDSDLPSYVVSSDLFLSSNAIAQIKATENAVLLKYTENQRKGALRGSLNSHGRLVKTQKGSPNSSDPEVMGVFKISCPDLLQSWKARCLQNPHLLSGENLPLDQRMIQGLVIGARDIFEINTPDDYVTMVEVLKNEE